VGALHDHQLTETCTLAIETAVAYDYLLTLKDEIEFVWRRKKTVASIIYLLLRYTAITGMVAILAAIFSGSTNDPDTCKRVSVFLTSTGVIIGVLSEVMVIMRINVLYLGNRIVVGFLLCFMLCHFAYMVWINSHAIGILLPRNPVTPSSCVNGIMPSAGNTAPWALLPSVFDFITCALIIWRIYGSAYFSNEGIVWVMFKDGTVYFACLLFVNVAIAITFLRFDGELKAVIAPAGPA